MADPFLTTVLSTGDYFTQTDQRQMNTNALYNRERSDFLELPYDDFGSVKDLGAAGTPSLLFSVKINGSTVTGGSTTVSSGTGTVKLGNLDISGLSAGSLNTLQITAISGSAGASGKVIRFVKRQDHSYMTVWAECDQTSAYDADLEATITTFNCTDTSVITHRQSQAW